MKSIKIFTIALVALGFSVNTFAQSTATASSTALFLVPISITKNTDMNFGTLASSATAGTAVLSTSSVLSKTEGVTIVSGTPTAAQFTVTGEGSKTFSVSRPASIELTGPASATLTLTLADDLSGTTGTLSSGTKVIKVGGTLAVPANTVAGTYSNATGLYVTVNYN